MKEMWQITSQLMRVPEAQSFYVISDDGRPRVIKMNDLYILESEREEFEKGLIS